MKFIWTSKLKNGNKYYYSPARQSTWNVFFSSSQCTTTALSHYSRLHATASPPPLSNAVSLSMKPDGFLCHTDGWWTCFWRALGRSREAARHSLSRLSQTAMRLILDVPWQLVCSRPRPLQAGSTPVQGKLGDAWHSMLSSLCSHINVYLPPFLHCSHCSLYRVPLHQKAPCSSSFIIPCLKMYFLCSSELQWCKETLWAWGIWHSVNVLSLL